jgi:predicted subunit of tRNA(5-methylaminomethyl-2-thiouridylate) methyltransferase
MIYLLKKVDEKYKKMIESMFELNSLESFKGFPNKDYNEKFNLFIRENGQNKKMAFPIKFNKYVKYLRKKPI